MDQLISPALPLKSALFVDFDNIYIGLSKTDPVAAERFASDPARWLSWLERGLPVRGEEKGPARSRSILIRRCYPNPDAGFRRFRSFFTSAAFSVIDCPTLTRTGKNSSDIYMVMDILDTLNHKTNFDEFIIFSGDSDFMPVLLRLRAYDRRTTTLAIDFMPPAYKAACDLVISEEEFIEDALGVSSDGACGGSGVSRSRVPMPVLKDMAARVYETVCNDGEVAGADLPDILKDFREFRDSNNWLGFGTSQRLAEALVCCEGRLNLIRMNPMMYKLVLTQQLFDSGTERVEQQPLVVEPPLETPVQFSGPASRLSDRGGSNIDRPASDRAALRAERLAPPVPRTSRTPVRTNERLARAELSQLREQVIALVTEMVSASSSPILLARASQYVVSKLGPQVLETQWAGAGSFKRLLQGAGDLGLEITTQPEPGYIYDRQRHANPAQRGSDTGLAADTASQVGDLAAELDSAQESKFEPAHEVDAEGYLLPGLPQGYEDEATDEEEAEDEAAYEESLPSLEEFIRRVSQVTGAPDLSPQQYSLVFRGIVAELQAIAEGQKIYNTYQSSKAVSDWCIENGENIPRSDVVLIFKGIIFQDGVRFGKRPGSYNALELASVVRNNIKALCRRSRLELSEYETHLLDEWILGELGNSENQYAAAAQSSNFDAASALGSEDLSPEI